MHCQRDSVAADGDFGDDADPHVQDVKCRSASFSDDPRFGVRAAGVGPGRWCIGRPMPARPARDDEVRSMTTRTLRRPLPIDPAAFLKATRDLSLTEVGAFTVLASAWWPKGTLPERPSELGVLLGLQAGQAKAVAARLAPQFAPGSYLALMRGAHVAKAERRARAGRKGMSAMRAKIGVMSHRHCQTTH